MVESSDRQEARAQADAAASHRGLDAIPAVPDDQGVSLDELGQAYAQLLHSGEDPYEPPDPAAATTAEEVLDQQTDDLPDDACDLCPKSILEAILFVGHPANDALAAEEIAALMRGVPPREIDELVDELNEDYREHQHPYHIVSVGAGFRLVLRDEFSAMRNAFYGRVREAKLSQAAMDVLAVIAYQQGGTREQVDQVRGRPSGALLSQLVRRQLLRVERTADKPRKPHYFTTDRFLDLFGLTSLDDLPQSQELD